MLFPKRGMHLEVLINYTIEKYNSERKALIFKNSPKIIIKNNKFYYFNKGTVDYHGTYKGKYLCFKAKSTKQEYLPWSNIKCHQWEYLTFAYELKSISFIIIHFELFETYHLIFIDLLIHLKIKGKLISWQWVNKNGYKIDFIYPSLLDFIKII